MEIQAYEAENDTTTQQRRFDVLLNRAQQASIECTDGDWERETEPLYREAIR